MHACVDRVQSRKRDVRTELRPGQRCVPQQLLQVPDVRATIVHERCHRMWSASRARRLRPTSSLRAKRFLTAVSRRARTWRRHCGSGTAQLGARDGLTTVGDRWPAGAAGWRPRFIVPEVPARPPTRILFDRPRHNQTLCPLNRHLFSVDQRLLMEYSDLPSRRRPASGA